VSRLVAALGMAAALAGGPGWAQEKEGVNTGQDPTKPLTRFDLRYQYQNLPPKDNDNAHIITPRVDKPFVLAPGWSLATRLDLPIFVTEAASPDNPDGGYEVGLGDTLVQGLLINAATDRFAWAVGAQLIAPTASQDQMGGGKWRVVPTLGARYSVPELTKGSFVAMVVRYDVSFAGDDGRRNVDELQLGPLLHVQLPHLWFVDLYPSTDIRYNAGDKRSGDTGRWFVPFNFMVGKMITPKIVTSLEVGVPIIDDYPVYDFKIEFRVGFFF
jgi:hypothetical protein